MLSMIDDRTMTDRLREALAGVPSIRAVARATGLNHASVLRFTAGKQSLRLDRADRLAEYFGLECRPAKPEGTTEHHDGT